MNAPLPINQLAGRGHNSEAAPLAEILAEELAADRVRADELLAAAAAARIESAADAGKVADLIALMRDHERMVDRARDTRKRPYLADCRIVDAAFGAIVAPLERARADTLAPLLTAWQQAHAAAPIPASIASVGVRREIKFEITEFEPLIAWLCHNHPNEMLQAARTIVGCALRSFGVDGAPHFDIPGVTVSVVSKTQVR